MKEDDIRPKELFAKYRELSFKDAQNMDSTKFIKINCPACSGKNHRFRFKKNGFTFVQCTDCNSLYCSPRPSRETLNTFYEQSESAYYWAHVFQPAVAEVRRKTLFSEKSLEIKKLVPNGPSSICDVGAGNGIFLEELQKVFPLSTMYAIEPSKELAAVCTGKGFRTLVLPVEQSSEWYNRFDLVVSTEVIEHVFSLDCFVRSLYDLTKPGGRVLLTGLGYEGFDILVLQEKSNSIFPPCHINFLSIAGFKILFKRVGYRSIDIWTPGVLDVDIVMNSGFVPEFFLVLAKREGAINDLQGFLRKYQLSSHVWSTGVKQ